jgi:hypothetical protein
VGPPPGAGAASAVHEAPGQNGQNAAADGEGEAARAGEGAWKVSLSLSEGLPALI